MGVVREEVGGGSGDLERGWGEWGCQWWLGGHWVVREEAGMPHYHEWAQRRYPAICNPVRSRKTNS